MDFGNITFLKSVEPITFLEKPTPKTKEVVAKIVNNKEFYDLVCIFRQGAQIPETGLSLREYEGRKFSELPIVSNYVVLMMLKFVATSLKESLGLSQEAVDQIYLLVFFNAFIDLKYFKAFITAPIRFILGRQNIAAATHDYPHEIAAILLPYNASQRDIRTFLTAHWKNEIESQLDTLAADPYLLRITKYAAYAPEIIRLRDVDGKSFPDIAKELEKRYPDPKLYDEFFTNIEQVRDVYYFFKNRWNQIGK